MAGKWNPTTKTYEPYELPTGASLYETDMEKAVVCAGCGDSLLYGDGYTSLQIHTGMGMGYCVCGECYQKERDDEQTTTEKRS